MKKKHKINQGKKHRKDIVKVKKEKRKWWKKLLSLFILLCALGVFAVFAFLIYIVRDSGKFDPNRLANKDQTVIYDSKNNIIAKLGIEKRESVTYDKLPQVLIDAIVATEDSRFFQHNGVDGARFLKAAVGQALGNSGAGGASTLTMQVVKNNFTSTKQSIIRKFKDIYLAVFFMERKYTKQEIMEFYVNDSFLGGSSVYGVEEASKYYFGKSVSDLSLPEAAIIAGMFFILKYVKKDIKNDFYSHDFVTGVFLIIIGCIIYIRVNVLTDFFQPVLGLIVLYSGVVKLQTAFDLMRMKFTTWKMVLILSVVNILISVVLLLRPGFLAKITFLVVGIALIYSGVSSLVASHFFQKGVKKYKKDVDIIDED